MSRSRRRAVHQSVNHATGFVRGPRIADLMTREYERLVVDSRTAERAGDATTALECHLGVPMFGRGAHAVLLHQLAGVTEEMTPWLWARWASYQCTRAEEKGQHGGVLLRAALDYTMRMFYSDVLDRLWENGQDPVTDLVAGLTGECWVFHQLCAFELGGFQEFLDHRCTGRLAEETGLARTWTGARMGGYRLLRAEAGTLSVLDLRSADTVPLLDLGAGVHADADGWLIGRLVPSGTTPEMMFDSRPLAVEEQSAREIAASASPGGWVAVLKLAIDEGRVDRACLVSEDRELLSDVPSLVLVEVGTPTEALAATMDQLRRGRDEVGRSAYRLLRRVAEGRFGPDDQAAYVAAAVLNPHAYAEARTRLRGPGPCEQWRHWAALVPEPARSRLEGLAHFLAPV